MSKFKIGDRVKILVGYYTDFTGTIKSAIGGAVVVVYIDKAEDTFLYSSDNLELITMPKFVEVKTKTVKKYAVVEIDRPGGDCVVLEKFMTEDEFSDLQQEPEYYYGPAEIHIVPTLFTEEEVPVKTETKYTFICKGGDYAYYGTSDKYKDLAEAKAATMNQAIQQIDSSAEEFEIE